VNAPQFQPGLGCHERSCFSTLKHNLGYDYDDALVKWVWKQLVTKKLQGGARSLED